MMPSGSKTRRGFALVLTIGLLALLVLAVYALSALVRVNAQTATAGVAQMQARQNALLGLNLALGELQRLAGNDSRVTGMAGVAGMPASTQMRHWCGVWDAGGIFRGWLTSGAALSPTPTLTTSSVIQLVEANSVGQRPGTASAYADEEYVDAGKVAIVSFDTSGVSGISGNYAYWVGDEGVKVSAAVPTVSPSGAIQILTASAPVSVARVTTAFAQFDSADARKVVAFEQATNLEYAANSKLTVTSLKDGFHHVTLLHQAVSSDGSRLEGGRVNINTTSAVVWRSLVESFNAASGTKFGTTGKITSATNSIANNIAGSSSGKSANGPFLSVASFGGSSLLSSAITGTNGVSVAQFMAVLGPTLTVRSDTFRIRAYGEVINPADGTTVEALAYCEAIVQRTPDTAPNGLGRRFVVTYFRWLGPGDI